MPSLMFLFFLLLLDMLEWKVYVLECSDGSLYTGITKDVDRRVSQHRRGKGAKYTRGRLPLEVLEVLSGLDKGTALKVESFIKKCPKKLKLRALKLFIKVQETGAT